MKPNDMKDLLRGGAFDKYSALYSDISSATERLLDAIDAFVSIYGDERDIEIFSVPGRSEICGNHTDHNHGSVLAGAIDRDIIAVAAKNDNEIIRLKSEGYDECTVDLKDVLCKERFEKYTSRALIGGVAAGFYNAGYKVGGYDAYTTTQVHKGSGISSSAAFEVMIGNIINHLYNNGSVDNKEIAKLAKFSENVYFGKPCGLMDQMSCAVGGFVYIDLENPMEPKVVPIDFSLKNEGYAMCIVNTGGSHANLNDDYASIPAEMKAVAAALGKEVLRPISEEDIVAAIPSLRRITGDRAILRALHFVRENNRVCAARDALLKGELRSFFDIISKSGKSSYEYLQNVYTTSNATEQGLSVALALADGYLEGRTGACRVHGGGFAGTIQVFLRIDDIDDFCKLMDGVFGKGSAMPYNIRSVGACRLF